MSRMQQRQFLFLIILFPCVLLAQPEKESGRLKALLQQMRADTNRVKTLLDLSELYLYRAGEEKSDLDSAMMFVTQAQTLCDTIADPAWKEKIQWLKVNICFEAKDPVQGIALCKRIANEFYHRKGDRAGEAAAWFRMGTTFQRNDSSHEALIYFLQQAALLYGQLGKPEQEILCLKGIADLHLVQGKLDESEKELLEVIERYKSIGFRNLHYTYDLLTAVSFLKGTLNRAIYFGLETIKSMEATGDTVAAAAFYYRLARVYEELGQTEQSVEWYKKSYLRKGKAKAGECLTMVKGLIKLGKAAEGLAFLENASRRWPPVARWEEVSMANAFALCYEALGRFDLAEKYYRQMIGKERSLRRMNGMTVASDLAIGQFYINQNRYGDAKTYLTHLLKVPPGMATLKQLKEAFYLLFKVDSAEGRYLSAIRNFERHKFLNDSVFNISKSRQIEELQIQYATEQKEKDLKILQNTNALQESRLQQANLARNITFGGGALLLAILGLLYNRFRLKQRSARQLELRQQEINQANHRLQGLLDDKERLLREIHHRVKNNLQIVMSLLNSQSVFLENEGALHAIRESQQRIHSISLIHQKLYQSDNLALINMAAYIDELVDYLQDSFDTGHKIRFKREVDPVELDVTQAVPLGLILNEAISNAIKYAFPNRPAGAVFISLHADELNRCTLRIADNGTGLPAGFDIDQCNSLGMSLMKGLSQQIHGTFAWENDQGLVISVVFEKEQMPASANFAVA